MQAVTSGKVRAAALEDGSERRRHRLRLVAGAASDYTLAQAAARGVRAALGDLYERHNRRVYAICLGMTRNPAEAEDLTQEVFIHLLGKAGSFRGESQFTTWLHRLTVNFVLMHLRRKNPALRQLSDDFELRQAALRFVSPKSNLPIADRIALESALRKLPLGCRTVFVLYDIAGYRHEEVAKVLGCSVGTSKSQLYRARLKLRKIMTARKVGFS